MVRILKPGKIVKKKTICKLTCPYCGCEFEFEVEDFHKIEKKLDGDAWINCPWCHKEIKVKRSELETREEEIVEPDPIVIPSPTIPFNPNPDYDPWRYPDYPDPFDDWMHKYTPPKDPCADCPNKNGLTDLFGNPIVGDSPCQWCPHYKWRVTWATTECKVSSDNLMNTASYIKKKEE